MKRFLSALVVSSIFFSVSSVSAYSGSEVLESSTSLSHVEFPALSSGPGYILPDNPLYVFDKLYQQVRLALVFTPENKARLHTDIAGERLAELRVVTSRNNQTAIDTALVELNKESLAAAQNLRDASAQGKNVTQLARDIHQTLADYRAVITSVKDQAADSSFGQKLASSADVLWEAKIISEDALPASEIEHELAANIEAEVDEAVLGVTTQSEKLEKKLATYEKFASKAAEAKIKKEQADASRSALQEQRKEIVAQRQKAIKDYLAKTEALKKQREQELAKLKQTIKDLQVQLKQLQSTTKAVPTPVITQ